MSQESVQDPSASPTNYDSCDLTVPEHLTYEDRVELLKWKYNKEGHRLVMFEDKIPHLRDYEYHSLNNVDLPQIAIERTMLDGVKNVLTNLINVKERCTTLQEECEVLKWHLSSIVKEKKIKEMILYKLASEAGKLQDKIQVVTRDLDQHKAETRLLNLRVAEQQARLERCTEDYEEGKKDIETMKENDEMLLERRFQEVRGLDAEHNLRQRQWKKLELEIMRHKNIHEKAKRLREAQEQLYHVYNDLNIA